jgi:hypothetical protein
MGVRMHIKKDHAASKDEKPENLAEVLDTL